MAQTDLLSSVVSALARVADELVNTIASAGGLTLLLQRSGRLPPYPPPPVIDRALDGLAKVREALVAQESSFKALACLSDAMTTIMTTVQQLFALDSKDDAWNLVADWFDLVAIDRLRRTNPASVAMLSAMHLLSDDRLLFGNLVKARGEVGNYLLGSPSSDDMRADNAALIGAALIAVAGYFIPQEDDKHRSWHQSMLFGWDPDSHSPAPHAQRTLQRMATVRFTHHPPAATPDQQMGLTAVVVPPSSGGWGVLFGIEFGAGVTFPIREHLALALSASEPGLLQAFFSEKPFVAGGTATSSAKILLSRKAEPADHCTIGPENEAHLEIGTFRTGFELGDPMRFLFSVGDGALVLPKTVLGFMGDFMPEAGLELSFDVDLQFKGSCRPSFAGGAGMKVTLPINRTIPGLRMKAVTLAFAIEERDARPTAELAATVAFGLDIAGLELSVDGIGAQLAWVLPSPRQTGAAQMPVTHGNLGPAGDLGIDFVAPGSVRIGLAAAQFSADGYLFVNPDVNPGEHSYGGALEAAFVMHEHTAQAKAVGLLRDGNAGWDLLVFLSVEFLWGIPLVAGIQLTRAGLIAGINVTVDTDRLKASVRNGSIGRLMVPDHLFENARAIIETMSTVFPGRKDSYIIGIMLQANFADKKAELTMGIALVTKPPTLILFGKLCVADARPTKDAIACIEADFAGDIDLQSASFSFDATLVHSRISAYPLTGDLALRAGSAGFLLTVGGFHPCFPPPVQVPKLKRLALDISKNRSVKIRAEAYFAVSANALQFGGKITLDIDATVSLHGSILLDALLEWEPRWRFSVHCAARLEVRARGRSLAGVAVDLLLEGPQPVHAKGRASVRILFFTIHVHFNLTWNMRDLVVQLVTLVNAIDEVIRACRDDSAWVPIAPTGHSLVTLRPIGAGGLRLHPYGTLRVSQNVAPFGVSITRIGARRVVGDRVTLSIAPTAGSPGPTLTRGLFAKSQFIDMSDHDKLTQPSFEPYQDGIIFGARAATASTAVRCSTAFETVFVASPHRRSGDHLAAALLKHSLHYGQVARSGLHVEQLGDGAGQHVTVLPPSWGVASGASMHAVAPSTFDSFTAAEEWAGTQSGIPDALVVGAHELMP